MKQKDNNQEKENQFNWTEKLEQVAGGLVKGMMGGLIERMKERLHEMLMSFQKSLAGTFLLIVGAIFIFVGMAIFINDLVRISNGIGYALVGVATLLIGLIIIKK